MTNGNGRGPGQEKEPVERVLDLFVHLPIGFAVMAWKRLPALVGEVPELVGSVLTRGCSQLGEVEARVAEEVRKARMIGQVAVMFGGRQVRREVDSRVADVRRRAEEMAGFGPGEPERASSEAPAPEPRPAQSAPPRPPAVKRTGPRTAPGGKAGTPARKAGARAARKAAPARKAAAPGAAADLPIPEYDGLSASQVVSRLGGLTPAELQAVRAYESATRARRTVLAAIDRLTA